MIDLLIVPSVDILKGKVVRLTKGRVDESKVYSDDPVSKAQFWVREGASLLHVVDLDGALGSGDNIDYILKIASSVAVPIQSGGGIRTMAKARVLLDSGIHRIVLGTFAFKSHKDIKELVNDYGEDRVMVAVDYAGKEVMVKGWLQSSGLSIWEALSRFKEECGVSNFLMTSIERDGLLQGPDFEIIQRASKMKDVKIFVSGGFTSLNDLRPLRGKLQGVIIGKALYEGLFTLKEAMAVVGDV